MQEIKGKTEEIKGNRKSTVENKGNKGGKYRKLRGK